MKAAQLFIITLLLAISYFLFPSRAFAQTNQPVDLHNYTQRVMIEVTSALSCAISGIDLIEKDGQCLGVQNGKIGPVDTKGGAIGVMGNLIAMTFTPPAHTSDYVKYLAGNFGLAKPAYAQGVGFAGISPLLPLWTAFRNITYLVFVIVFVVIGFAIMLRVHIDPRTVMTIENQIPRIIVGLILVTFSFAIAGVLIDLMWVLTYLVIGIFTSIQLPGGAGVFTEKLNFASQNVQGENALGIFNNIVGFKELVGKSTLGVATLVRDLFTTQFTPVSTGWDNIPVVGGIVQIGLHSDEILRNLAGYLIASFAGILALIIISIAVLYSLFRIWFTLIQAYVFILLDIVFAPFWVVAGVLPGANISFSAWLRDIASNLLAFPATIMMFLLVNVFVNAPKEGVLFVPPLIGNANSTGVIENLIGLGIILITPNIVTLIKAALKAPKLEGAGLGQAIGMGAGFPINVARGVGGIVMAEREGVPDLAKGGFRKRTRAEAFFGSLLGRR